MRRHILIINNDQIERVKTLLDDCDIHYREAGYPNGSVEVIESYPSKINRYAHMKSFAKSKGYKSVPEAINKMGGGRSFRMKFDNEFVIK